MHNFPSLRRSRIADNANPGGGGVVKVGFSEVQDNFLSSQMTERYFYVARLLKIG